MRKEGFKIKQNKVTRHKDKEDRAEDNSFTLPETGEHAGRHKPLRRLGTDAEEDSGKNAASSSQCSLRPQEAHGLEGPGPGRSRMKTEQRFVRPHAGLDLTGRREVYSLEKDQSEGLVCVWVTWTTPEETGGTFSHTALPGLGAAPARHHGPHAPEPLTVPAASWRSRPSGCPAPCGPRR